MYHIALDCLRRKICLFVTPKEDIITLGSVYIVFFNKKYSILRQKKLCLPQMKTQIFGVYLRDDLG